MNKTLGQREGLLVAMSAAGGGQLTPVQVQKLMFLIDKNLGEEFGVPLFDFQPYSYGPYDKAVYDTLRTMEQNGEAAIRGRGSTRTYQLTPRAHSNGSELRENLGAEAASYIDELADFVRSLTFTELVQAIYKAYPDMKANSVFQD